MKSPKYIAALQLLLVWALVFAYAFSARAQPCTCTDCPEPLPPIADFEICYDVAGHSNPTLGANGQAVCGVSLDFSHDYIENLTITLISPSGQQVRLVGPGSLTPGTIATSGSRWTIDFIDCSIIPTPYPGTGPRFSGASPAWGVLGRYTGTYHPNLGCLSNFNSGPVDGQWCVRIRSNAITSQVRQFRNFEVRFCDESGNGCCDAVEPAFASTALRDTTLCTGDSYLSQNIQFTPPPSSIYEQRILVSRNDTVVEYVNSTLDLSSVRPGTYLLCGIQSWQGAASRLPVVGAAVQPLFTAIQAATICAKASPNCTRWTILPRPLLTLIDTTLCNGDSLRVGGQTLRSPSNQTFNLRSAGGCDSLVEVRLRYSAPTPSTVLRDLCQGSSFVFGASTISTGGTYRFPLLSQFGCDSTITLIVTERLARTTTIDTAICSGDSINIGGTWIKSSGAFRQNLQSSFNCDSIVTFNVSVLNPIAQILATDSTLTCSRNSLSLTSLAQQTPGAVSSELSWSSLAGTVLSTNPSVQITAPGLIILQQTLSLNNTSCSHRDTLDIRLDTLSPRVTLPDTFILTCDSVSRLLSPSITQGGRSPLATWTAPDGTVSNMLSLRSFNTGRYTLSILNPENGCTATASTRVLADRIAPQIQLAQPDTITCTRDSVELRATILGTSTAQLSWRRPSGSLVPVQAGISTTLFVRETGQYWLIARYPNNGCVDSSSVVVLRDTASIQVAILQPDTLTCQLSSTILRSQTNRAASFVWQNSTGTSLGTADTLLVSLAGEYVLLATDMLNGCQSAARVELLQDTLPPNLILPATDTIKCGFGLLPLRANVANNRDSLIYDWFGPPGGIVGGGLGSSITLSMTGVYRLRITSLRTGCSTTDSTLIIDGRSTPFVDAGPDQALTCSISSVLLGTSASGTGSFDYSWSGPPGTFAGPLNRAQVSVIDSGKFILQVRDLSNGCIARDTVLVSSALGLPSINLPDTAWIACGDSTVLISASGSIDPNLSRWHWTSSTLILGADSSTAQVLAKAPGLLTVQLQDTSNACLATASIVVAERCPLTLELSAADTIDCYTGSDISLSVQSALIPGVTLVWTTSNGQILSGANTDTVRIRGPGSYHLALRRPGTRAILRDSILVVADTLAPGADAGPSTTLTCVLASACLTLPGTSPSIAPNLSFSWATFGGRFCADTIGQQVRINAPGIYELTVFNPANGCSSRSAVAIDVEPGVPIPDAGVDRILSCARDTLELIGTPPRDTSDLTWWWTDATGQRLTQNQVRTLRIATPGQYAFAVQDGSSGCTVADSVFVVERGCSPNARPQANGMLSCRVDSVTLSTPEQTGMSYSWRGVDVAFGPVNSRVVTVRQPGTYKVFVQEMSFGLLDSATVTVSIDSAAPMAGIAFPQNLTCARDSVRLDASGSNSASGQSLQFSWRNSTGNQIADESTTWVKSAGTYQVNVLDIGNGCIDSTTIQVLVDTVPPRIITLIDGSFDCNTTQVAVDAIASVSAGSLSFKWTPLAGQTLLGASLSRVITYAPGPIEVRATDQETGCMAIDTIMVPSEASSFVNAGPDLTLDCRNESTQLQASASAGSSALSWSTAAGLSCIDDPSRLDPTVSCVGTYVLTWVSADGACTYRDSVKVSAETPNFNLEILGDTLLTCQQSSLILTGRFNSPRLQGAWSGVGQGSDSTITITQGGRLVWRATDAAGCVDSVSRMIRVDTSAPRITVFDPDTLSCLRSETLLRVEVLGVNNAGIQWTDEAGNPLTGINPRITKPGSYSFVVTNPSNGCMRQGSVNVIQDTIAPRLRLDAPGGVAIDCNNPRLSITASDVSATTELRWSGPAGQTYVPGARTQEILFPGRILVTALNPSNGCQDTASVLVLDERTPIGDYRLAAAGEIGCTGAGVALIAELPAEVDGQWFDTAGNPLPDALAQSAGTYRIEMRHRVSGCIRFDSVRVRAYTPGYSITLSIEGELDCTDKGVLAKAELQGTLPTGLSLSFVSPSGDTIPTTLPELEIREIGLWTVVARHTGDSCYQLAQAPLLPPPGAITGLEARATDAGCPGERGGQITLFGVGGGTPPFRYQLNEGLLQTVPQFALLEGGIYRLKVIDAAECSYEQEVLVPQAPVKSIFLPTSIKIDLGDSVCIEPLIEGQYSPDSVLWVALWQNLSCDTCLELCFRPLESDILQVQVWFGSCRLEAETELRVVPGDRANYPNAFSPDGDGVNDEWWVLPKGGRINYARIFDRWGNMVFESIGDQRGLLRNWDGQFKGESLPVGVYVLVLTGEDLRGESWSLTTDVTLLK